MSTESSKVLQDEELLHQSYPSGAPIIIQVAFKYGYGPAIVELNRKVYFNEEPLFSDVIREALQGVILSSCENKYCLAMHMRGLVAEGFSLAEVRTLIDTQTLPERIDDHLRWGTTLRRLSTISREGRVAMHLYDGLRKIHSDEVVDAIGGVVAFSLLHKVLLDLYPDEIRIEEEPILFRTIDCGDELIRAVTEIQGVEHPLYTLCCVCKDVKLESGWIPIERALPQIPSDAAFSHGYCGGCHLP
ncbi:MAG: hypothetical protein AAF517_20350 [Planctomycetota bacterium]